jgi:hypothetical protein
VSGIDVVELRADDIAVAAGSFSNPCTQTVVFAEGSTGLCGSDGAVYGMGSWWTATLGETSVAEGINILLWPPESSVGFHAVIDGVEVGALEPWSWQGSLILSLGTSSDAPVPPELEPVEGIDVVQVLTADGAVAYQGSFSEPCTPVAVISTRWPCCAPFRQPGGAVAVDARDASYARSSGPASTRVRSEVDVENCVQRNQLRNRQVRVVLVVMSTSGQNSSAVPPAAARRASASQPKSARHRGSTGRRHPGCGVGGCPKTGRQLHSLAAYRPKEETMARQPSGAPAGARRTSRLAPICLAALLVSLALPTTAPAQLNPSTDGWILAASHAPGLQGSIWRTDLWVRACTNGTGSATLTFCKAGENGTAAPGYQLEFSDGEDTVYVEDVVDHFLDIGGGSWLGAIHYVSEYPVQVYARVYSISPDGSETYGQVIEGVPTADRSMAYNEPGYPGTGETSGCRDEAHADNRYRVNIGW